MQAAFFATRAPASAFALASQVPNLFSNLFSQAALSAAFVPVFTEMLQKGRKREAFQLASTLFSTAYLRTGAELDAIRASRPDFVSRIAAMVGHFCALYDADAALFRFMLIAQQDLLPRIGDGGRLPVVVIEACESGRWVDH